jgi:acetyl esterase/lipase
VANAHAFAARGWRGISVDYPLGDLVAAYRSVENDAGALRGRRGPLIAIGQSAGGTMAEWLAAHNEVDAAVAVDAPANLVSWRAIQPGEPLAWLPARVAGIDHSGWALSPVRVYRGATSAPLLVFGAQDDHLVEPAQQSAMHELGAELAWTPGEHLISRRWRSRAASFVRRVTRR